MLSTLSRFQRALTPETVARHQPRGGGRQSDGTPSMSITPIATSNIISIVSPIVKVTFK